MDFQEWNGLGFEPPMCEDCRVETKALDLRIGLRKGYAEGYGIALIECPSCLTQEERKVALSEGILLAAGKRFDHGMKFIEEFGFIATFEPVESHRPRHPVGPASGTGDAAVGPPRLPERRDALLLTRRGRVDVHRVETTDGTPR